MTKIVGEGAQVSSYGRSKSKGKESGVSRLSVGFRHLMDWSRETPNSIITQSGLGQSVGGSASRLTGKLNYNMKAGQASNLPGGGFPRAEAAVITGFPQETMSQAGFSKSPLWFNKYIRHMEYLVAEQSGSMGHYDGTSVLPGTPTRRWIYGIPSRQPATHTAGDANQPIFEALLKAQTKIDADDKSSEVNKIYRSIYLNMLQSLNTIQSHNMTQLVKFLSQEDSEGENQGLARMGQSMLDGLLKEELDDKAQEFIKKEYGGEKGERGLSAAKSRQELLAILSNIGIVVTTGHGELGGSEPMDVLFNKPQTLFYPDSDKGPNKITIRLADISEEDWTKPGHHGTGTGKTQMNTRKEIYTHYNKKGGRIETYNNLIKLIRKYVDMKTSEAGLSGKGTIGAGKTDQTWDAWYRRRATQIASDIQEGVKLDSAEARKGAGAAQRGKQDLLRLELMEFIAQNEAIVAAQMGAIETVSKEDLKHVLHHMGSANAVYEGLNNDAEEMFPVNEYGEMIAFNQKNGEEFTVVINFKVNEKSGKDYGLVEKLKLADIAIIKQSLAEIFISFWGKESGLTDKQMYEAWDLLTTVSGMTKFASYFAETVGVATAIPGSKGQKTRFTVRADAAIPAYMDDLMYMFFHGGNKLMKRGIGDLLSDMDRIAQSYSSTLRTDLWGKLRDRWPTYAWGSQHGKYGQGANSSRTHSDERHPPTGLFHQEAYGVDFGRARQFWPQQTPQGGPAGPQPFQEVPTDPNTGKRKRRSTEKPLDEEEYKRDTWGAVAEDMRLDTIDGKIAYGETDMDALGYGRRRAGPKDQEREWRLPGTPWWSVAPVMWTPRHTYGPNIPAGEDSLDFIWAAPYVTWQHYQMSGSVK